MDVELVNIANIFNGKDYKKNPPGDNIPIYGTGGVMGYTSESLYSGPAVLSGRKGSINSPLYVEGHFWNVDTIFCIKPKHGISAKWLYYNFLNTDLSKLNEATGVPSVSSSALYRLKFRWFDKNEQIKIVEVLNEIDEAIRQTKKIVSKYKRIGTGLMQDLLGNGIDSKGNIRSKASHNFILKNGLEVPETWEVIELGNKNYFDLATGGTPSTDRKDFWENGNIPWMSSGEVHKKEIYSTDNFITEAGFRNSNARFFPVNSIVMALAGQGKTRGTVAINKIELTSNQSVAAIIPNKSMVDSDYIFFYFENGYETLRSISAGSGRAGLTLSILSSIKVPIPKKDEQVRISKVINANLDVIKTESINLAKLNSLKTGLMQDLLSGKIRVK